MYMHAIFGFATSRSTRAQTAAIVQMAPRPDLARFYHLRVLFIFLLFSPEDVRDRRLHALDLSLRFDNYTRGR